MIINGVEFKKGKEVVFKGKYNVHRGRVVGIYARARTVDIEAKGRSLGIGIPGMFVMRVSWDDIRPYHLRRRMS